VLRLWNSGDSEFWIDEYGTWWVASASWGETWQRAIAIQGQSPFYYLLVRACLALIGDVELACRLPSYAAGLASLALVPIVARKVLADARLALLAGFAFALNQVMIFQAQDARPYALGVCCALLSFLALLSAIERDSRARRVAWIAATAATWYVHYLLGMLLVVQAGWLAVLAHRKAIEPRRWLPSLLALLAAMLPGAVQFVLLFGRRRELDWLPDSGVALRAFEIAGGEFLHGPALALAVLAAALLGGAVAARPGARIGLLACWFVTPFLLVTLALWAFGVQLVYPRYVALAAPAAAIGIALLLGGVPGSALRRWLPAAAYAVLVFAWYLLPALAQHGTFCKRFEQRWGEATREMLARWQTGDVVLYRSGYVETDRVLDASADPLLRAFVEWPVRAHLPPDAGAQLAAIPFRETPQTLTYLNGVLAQAASLPRVWILGWGAALDRVVDAARSSAGVTIAYERDGPGVRLVLVTRG
jgi:uncharacterized membrane protein